VDIAISASNSAIAAYCDVDGTLTHTTIVAPLVWMKQRALPSPWNWLWLASLAARAPWWWLLDQFSRAASNRAIYANYRGVSADLLRRSAAAYYQERIRPKMFAAARLHLAQLRQQGFRLVLVTGGLDLFMQPMAAEFEADCLAPALEERNGVFTGRLCGPPFTGPEKNRAVRAHAAAHGIDLAKSCALGDAIGDLPMLECVGHPVAVNPDARLARVARQRGWRVENWKTMR